MPHATPSSAPAESRPPEKSRNLSPAPRLSSFDAPAARRDRRAAGLPPIIEREHAMSHRTSRGWWGMRVAAWAAASAAALGATALHLRAADDDKPEDKKPAIDPAEPKPNPKPGPATKPIVVKP